MDKAKQIAIGNAIELVYTGIRIMIGSRALATLFTYVAIDFFAYTTSLKFIWHNWKLVLIATLAFIGVAISIWHMANN